MSYSIFSDVTMVVMETGNTMYLNCAKYIHFPKFEFCLNLGKCLLGQLPIFKHIKFRHDENINAGMLVLF